jgi:hypothetical protein
MQLYVRIVRSELASKNELQQLECTHAHCHATNKSLTEQAQRMIERDRKRFWQKEKHSHSAVSEEWVRNIVFKFAEVQTTASSV